MDLLESGVILKGLINYYRVWVRRWNFVTNSVLHLVRDYYFFKRILRQLLVYEHRCQLRT
jgi:hypothetical protein